MVQYDRSMKLTIMIVSELGALPEA